MIFPNTITSKIEDLEPTRIIFSCGFDSVAVKIFLTGKTKSGELKYSFLSFYPAMTLHHFASSLLSGR